MRFILLVSLVFLAALSTNAIAQDGWRIDQIDSKSLPFDIVPDTRKRAPKGLPDGRIAVGDANATLSQAWYSKPTKRYGHGILGDGTEGGSLVAVTLAGGELEYLLPENLVFEDITPRIADLDGDGSSEIITIISHVNAGASLGIFQINDKKLELRAQSDYIGRAFRWLNVAGIDHYTGSNARELAIVVTPHIGGRLDLYKFVGTKLTRIASKQGFSNHYIGSREQRLSASYVGDGKRVNLALPSANRRSLLMMSVGADGWQQIGKVSFAAPIDKAILATGSGKKVKFTMGLSDGSVYRVSRY